MILSFSSPYTIDYNMSITRTSRIRAKKTVIISLMQWRSYTYYWLQVLNDDVRHIYESYAKGAS